MAANPTPPPPGPPASDAEASLWAPERSDRPPMYVGTTCAVIGCCDDGHGWCTYCGGPIEPRRTA